MTGPEDYVLALRAPMQQVAAFHGLATNPAVPERDRLGMALQALDGYEAELERLRADHATTIRTFIRLATDTAQQIIALSDVLTARLISAVESLNAELEKDDGEDRT